MLCEKPSASRTEEKAPVLQTDPDRARQPDPAYLIENRLLDVERHVHELAAMLADRSGSDHERKINGALQGLGETMSNMADISHAIRHEWVAGKLSELPQPADQQPAAPADPVDAASALMRRIEELKHDAVRVPVPEDAPDDLKQTRREIFDFLDQVSCDAFNLHNGLIRFVADRASADQTIPVPANPLYATRWMTHQLYAMANEARQRGASDPEQGEDFAEAWKAFEEARASLERAEQRLRKKGYDSGETQGRDRTDSDAGDADRFANGAARD